MESYTNHPLAPYTTVKIGGPADTFITTQTTEEFIEVLKETNNGEASKFRSAASEGTLPKGSSTSNFDASHKITILGNGSNVLISDSGIRGIVIKNNSNNIEFLPNHQIKVDSGVQLPLLINQTANHSLTGLEEFAYIPSSVGGAIYGNIHGVNKNDFNKFLVSIEVFNLQSQSLDTKLASDLAWSYDTSEFKDHPEWIIVSCILQLQPGNATISHQTIADIIAKKITSQSMNSLGCVFKNPLNDSAGRIIDQELGLKGFQLGDAQVSEKHANFIVNLGHATATDYYSLIKKIRTEAKNKGFDLETEIKFLGDFA